MRLTKYQRVAAIVLAQVTDGTLPPGASAPSGAALSRITGFSVLTCRRALRTLVADGVLVPGASGNARPRVPGSGADHDARALTAAQRALCAALAAYRRAAGLTQPQLAQFIGVSVTAIGHAETGRNWQSRPFWELADKALDADGELLRLHDDFRAAQVPAGPAPGTGAAEAEGGHGEPGIDPAGQPDEVIVDASGPVASVTIAWSDGTTTTVHPPSGESQRSVTPAG
jgi:DNA-binding XRE family transcriptional regulator